MVGELVNLRRSAEYRRAVADFRHACDQWARVGEPPTGPEFDRIQTARRQFLKVAPEATDHP